MSAAQTGLAAGREWRESQKKKHNSCSVQAGAREPGTVTLICLPRKGPLSEPEHWERVGANPVVRLEWLQRICQKLLGSLFKGQRLSKPGNGGGRPYAVRHPRGGDGSSWNTPLLCSYSSRSCSLLPVLAEEGLTACCAMVTDD